MANAQNILPEGFEKEFQVLLKNLGLADKEVEKLIGSINELKGANQGAATSQSGLADKTKKLTSVEKELQKIEKASQKVNVEVAKAQIQLTEKRKAARKEAEKLLRIQKKTSFTEKLGGAFKAAALQVTAIIAALSGVIKAAKAYVKLVSEVNKQNAQVAATFDLSQQGARGLTTEMRKLATAFDKDFNDVLKSANILAKEFGLEGEAALDLIREGLERGADVNGEFLELLKEYPAQLKSVGLNASETIAIITQTERAGVFSDKGIDAIKEAGIRLRELTPATAAALDGIGLSSKEIERSLADGSKSLFQVTQEVSQKLSELPPQSKVVGTAIADIFGGAGEDAGLRFLTSLKDINTELSEVESSLSEDQKATIRLKEAWEDFQTTSVGSGGILTSIKNGLANLIVGLIQFRNNFVESFNDAIRSSSILRAAITTLVEAIKLNFKTIFKTIKLTLIDPFIAAFNLISEVSEKGIRNVDLGKVLKPFKEDTLAIVDNFKQAGITIADAFKGDNIEKYLLMQKDVGEVISYNAKVLSDQVEAQKELNKASEASEGSTPLLSPISPIAPGEVKSSKKPEDIANQQILAQTLFYQQGKQNAQEYAFALLEIERNRLNQELALKIQNKDLTITEEISLRERLAEINDEFNEIELEKEQEKQDQIIEKRRATVDVTQSLANSLFDFGSALGDRELANLEKRRDKGLITEEQFAKKQAEIKRKQAIADKIQALFNIAISGAQWIVQLGAQLGVAAPPFQIAAGIATAAQAGVVLAQPLPPPAFREGGTMPYDGVAKTSEEGSELYMKPSGEIGLTPAFENLQRWPAGTEFLDHETTKSILKDDNSDMILAELKATREAIQNKAEYHSNVTERGMDYFVKRGKNRQNFIDKNFR